MVNSVGSSGFSLAGFSNKPNEQLPQSIQHILKELHLDVSNVHFDVTALTSSLLAEETRKTIKKRLDDIAKSKSTVQPDANILNLLGVQEKPENLEFFVSKGGVFLVKASLSDIEEEEDEDG